MPVNSIITFAVMISTPLGVLLPALPAAALSILARAVSLDRALLAALDRERTVGHVLGDHRSAPVLASRPIVTGATSIVSEPIRAPEPTTVVCFE